MVEINKVSKLDFLNTDSIQPKVDKHEDTVCSKCGSSSTSRWLKKYDESGNWNGEYICIACYHNPAYRSGELNPNSNVYKGIVSVRTVAEVLGDKDCIIMKEGSPFDICSIRSNRYGKIEVKTATYNPIYAYWQVGHIKPEFDTLFIICTDSKFENVIRVYVIHIEDIGNIGGITIYKDPKRWVWYKEFRVDNIVQYQEAFQIVKNESQTSRNYIDSSQNLMSNKEKGDICEEIVRIAINAKASTDVYHDLVHKGYKRIEVKGSNYYSRHKYWHVGNIKPNMFNTLFIVCMNDNFEEVERVYIIPRECVCSIKTIAIYKNPLYNSWCEEFRVSDITQYQRVCKKILSGNKII